MTTAQTFVHPYLNIYTKCFLMQAKHFNMIANKIGLTIEEAAEYSGIGRDTIRRMVEWEKLPALRIGRKSIIRADTLEHFMEINQGVDLLEREQIRSVKIPI